MYVYCDVVFVCVCGGRDRGEEEEEELNAVLAYNNYNKKSERELVCVYTEIPRRCGC